MNQDITTYLSKQDDILKQIIDTVPYPIIDSTKNVFHDLMSLVIEQQIHYRSSKHIFTKAMERAGLKSLSLENLDTFINEGISTLKITEKKYDTIAQVVDFFENNQIDWEQLNNAEINALFKPIKGVGVKSVDMILLYTLERPDVFIADDYHLKLIMTPLYTINPASKVNAQLKAIASQWSPYQSSAVKYLLAWKSYHKKGLL